jgi:hypothetical protein
LVLYSFFIPTIDLFLSTIIFLLLYFYWHILYYFV